MVITLKPPPPQKPLFKPTKIFWTLVITIGILLFAFLSLHLYKWSLSLRIKDIQKEIDDIDKKRDIETEEEMKNILRTFEKAKPLLKTHRNARKIFSFLEENTYQGVTLSNFEANLKENTLSFNIASVATENLAIQIEVFRRAKLKDEKGNELGSAVSNIEVGGFSIDDKGTISLNLKLTVNPQLFKF